MRKRIIAGNWKMYKTASEANHFAEAVKNKVLTDEVESVICAPFTALPALTAAFRESPVKIGAQNLHWEDEGAYTGEVSGTMLHDLGVRYVIVGHSERRTYFNETDDVVNKKVHAAYKHHLIPIVCVGERLEEREAGQTRSICTAQTIAAFKGLTTRQAAQAVIAYEPIWAIGTGKSSTAADAAEVIAWIRGQISALYGEETAAQVRIQYGGSVKPDNIREYLQQPDIDGALIGGASLEPLSYIQLIEGAR